MSISWLARLLFLWAAGETLRIGRWHRLASASDREHITSLIARAAARPEIDPTPRLSGLVAAWNPGEDLQGLITSFRALNYADKELILAVGGAHRISELEHLSGNDLRLMQHPGGGKQAALRQCLQEATGDIIFLTDADSIIEPAGLLELIAPIARGETSVTTGRHVPRREQESHPFVRLQWAKSINNFAHLSDEPGVDGSNCCLTRTALREAGDFAEDVGTGTDVHLSECLRRAGYEITFVYESQIQVHYHERLLPYLRQQSRWLRNYAYDAQLRDDAKPLRGWHQESLLTIAFLILTALIPLRSRTVLALALPMLLRRYLAWLRQLRFAGGLRREPRSTADYGWAVVGLYVDALSRALAFFDYVVPARRQRW